MTIENLLDTITQSADIPLLTAFVLGILTAVNPCQLAINISALTYEYRNGNGWKDALTYSLGRTVTYTLLGWILMCLIGGGRQLNGFQMILSKGEMILPYAIILLGAYFISRGFHRHHHDGDNCHNTGTLIKRNGPLGSLILGMVLALAFCPESAVMYFGMMLPMSITSSVGILLPLLFGIGAVIPVVLMAWLMSSAEKKAHRISLMFEKFQLAMNIIMGIGFILFGLLLMTIEF